MKKYEQELAGRSARGPIRIRVPFRRRGRVLRRLAASVVIILAGSTLVMSPTTPARAACANPVVCENQLPGTPQSVWDVPDPSTNIQGFADPFSVNVGGSGTHTGSLWTASSYNATNYWVDVVFTEP